MDFLKLIDLKKQIAADGGRSRELMARALELLAEVTSQVDARQIAEAMGVWGAALMPAAREMLESKKASDRQKSIELFAAIADPKTIPRLEAARDADRSKKLRRYYDYAIRRIRKAAAERSRVRVDPKDASVDPVSRLVELAAMDLDAFGALEGVRGSWNVHYALPWLDFDKDGRRPFDVGAETWHYVFDGVTLLVERPDGERTSTVPKGTADSAKAELAELKKAVREAGKKRVHRLEEALRTGKTWPAWLWRLLYVDHPLADRSTHTLVFEVRSETGWRPFVVTEQRTFVDASGGEVEVPDSAAVRLAHPAETSPSTLQAWQQLADERGWTPPFSQLHRPVFTAKTDADLDEVVRGLAVPYARTLAARLVAAGFEPGEIDEHGLVVDRGRALGENAFFWLRHGAMHIRQSMNSRDQKTPVHRACFHGMGATAAPARAYSEAVLLLEQMVA